MTTLVAIIGAIAGAIGFAAIGIDALTDFITRLRQRRARSAIEREGKTVAAWRVRPFVGRQTLHRDRAAALDYTLGKDRLPADTRRALRRGGEVQRLPEPVVVGERPLHYCRRSRCYGHCYAVADNAPAVRTLCTECGEVAEG